ncbi:MAG: hypothetical protein D6701_07685 [Gemmatimonadetes bacterium]|nr:MAG: hypothetical protein D6701_07685 [Gemmatimonadota bacterium]
MFFPSGHRGARSAYLVWRVRLFLGGATVGVVGMALERAWVVNVALVLLGVGFALRFVPARGDVTSGRDAPPDRREDL